MCVRGSGGSARSYWRCGGAPIFAALAALAGCQPGGEAQQGAVQPPAATSAPPQAVIAPPATPSVLQAAVPNKIPPDASLDEVAAQAKVIGCFACHAIEKKLLGPAWRHVSALYRADPAGEAKVMEKIARGGSGTWGNVVMPAYPGLSESDRRALARYILSIE